MDSEALIARIKQSDLTQFDNLTALWQMARNTMDFDLNREVLAHALKSAKQGLTDFYDLYKKALLFAAPYRFDEYLQYVEWNREPEKKFYLPRRKVLKTIVDDMQDLADGKLDFLGVSTPPRIGKSTLGIFFMSWLMGRKPDVANLMSGHSDKLTDGFYREILAILSNPDTYLWHEVFPLCTLAANSAENETIDINKVKRFPTMTCRTILGTLTGAVEVGTGGCLYCDDLIEDLEESINPARLQAKYDAYLNQLKDRKKLGAFELMVSTRWNVFDPLGRIEQQYAGNPRYRFRVIPALNENNESNFNYNYSLGFDTKYYLDMKESIDDATWNAKYQGNPYIREGLLFPADDLKYYNGVLPDGEPDRIVSVCDVAWGGGDSLSQPFAKKFGTEIYITDVIFNRGDKEVTRPVVVGKMKQLKPHVTRFEANNGGDEYADNVDKALKKENIFLNISSKKAPTTQSKLSRIIQYSPEIKKLYFLKNECCDKEYRAFMTELTTFVQTGKNPHDDAADSLAMLIDFLNTGTNTVSVFKRPF